MTSSPDMIEGRGEQPDPGLRRLFELLDGMPFAASLARSADLTIVYVNLATVAMMRAEGPHELLGRRFSEFLVPDEVDKVRENVGALRSNAYAPHDHSYRFLRLDGSMGVAEVYATIMEHGGHETMLSILLDVTDREDAARARAEVERRYRNLVDAAPDGIVITEHTRIVFANRELVEMIGAQGPEELLGRSVLDVIPAEEHVIVERARERLEAGEPVVRFQTRMIRADWREIVTEISVITTEYEGRPAFQSFVRDVTEREQTLRARREAEEFARSILDSMPVGVYTFRLEDDGAIIFTGANPAAKMMIHVPYEDMVGRPYLEAFPWTRGSDLERGVKRVLSRGGQWECHDYLPVMFREHPRWFDVRIFPTGPGTVAMTFLDVTHTIVASHELKAHREELEHAIEERTAELKQANLKLEEATRAKSTFLASMSHELRTPLNSIIGFSSVLLQGMAGPLGEEQERQIGMINRAGRQLLALVGDVLDLEKIESGRLELSIAEFEVPRFVAQVAESVRPMVAEKGLRLEIDAARAPARMRGDRRRVQQVLHNFLSNAIKYTDTGFVRLDVQERDDGKVAFSVSDSGRGIAPEDLDRVFDEFRQLAGRDPKNPGSGLGLSIARHMAELMNGSVEVESTLGKGSTFTLVVPGSRPGPAS